MPHFFHTYLSTVSLEKKKGNVFILILAFLTRWIKHFSFFLEISARDVGRRACGWKWGGGGDLTWKVIIKVESSPCLHGLVVWGPGFTVMATLRYLMSLSRETLREIIPELNRICFESTEMSRARLCRRSPPLPCCANNGKASCLSVGQGCTSLGFICKWILGPDESIEGPAPQWKEFIAKCNL